MNKDIRISTSFFTHIKTRKSIKKYGSDFVLCLLKLWIYAAQNRAKGVLDGLSSDDIELLSDWNGDLQFTDICLELGWLDKNEQGVFSIHGWEEHQSFAMFAEERSAKARRAASKRWGCKDDKVNKNLAQQDLCYEHTEIMQGECSEHASSIDEAMQGECSAYAPSPIPSPSPLPNPKHNLTHNPISRARVDEPHEADCGERVEGFSPKKTDCPSKGNPEWPAFLSCWEVYPVKQGQENAWREWMRLKQNGTLAQAWEIRDAILAHEAEDSRWKKGMIPRLDRWLQSKGWNDIPFSSEPKHVFNELMGY